MDAEGTDNMPQVRCSVLNTSTSAKMMLHPGRW